MMVMDSVERSVSPKAAYLPRGNATGGFNQVRHGFSRGGAHGVRDGLW